ncbi:MAG: TetR/AcrR family transcriptional regulator [Pseudomonadota bacterium]
MSTLEPPIPAPGDAAALTPAAAATRARILEAAGRVFARKGFQAASLDEVARDIGLTKGAIYWHFRSKSDLFFALLDHKFQQNTAPVPDELRAAASTADPRQALTMLLKANFARLRAEPDWPRLYLEFIAQARDDDVRARLTQFHEASLALIATYVTAMQDAGLAPRDRDPHTAALFWCALFDGLLLAWIVDPATDLDAQVERIIDLLWQGIAPATPAGGGGGKDSARTSP